MEHARREGDASPGVCGRNTGTAAYAVAHQVDRAARLVAGKEQDVSDKYRTSYRWIDAWEGAHAGWCACELREHMDGTKEVHRSEPKYLYDMPDDSRMHAIFLQAHAHLMARTK